VSITDAMGHDTPAALLATLAVGALRNRRRALDSPAEQADAANDVVRTHAPPKFVTGLLMRILLSDGTVEIVDAGHPVPFLARDGDVTSVPLTTQLPLGLASTRYRTDTMTLAPGDRLLMVTDGYLDRLEGRLDVEKFLRASLDRHPRQVTRELGRAVREVTGGKLQDDATALCLDWYGPTARRHSTGGASPARATQQQ
jgi:serine phosphatase RsbU (regulator of sigma subunit)